MYDCVLITGGAGFVGSTLAIALARRFPDLRLIALDNLQRRGSELSLARLAQAGYGGSPEYLIRTNLTSTDIFNWLHAEETQLRPLLVSP